MQKPTIAVVSFPGNNCEFESLRAIAQSGMTPLYFRWNDDRAKLADVDGYFLVGGFSYEDRGRAGMVAGRDTLMDFIGQEAEAGKVVIGNCNGAQVLVESGLIPLDRELKMCLARNVITTKEGHEATGFLSEWVWITPTCKNERCATSDWQGAMHLPIAHGEGRFITTDPDVIRELKKNDQITFSYCDANGATSDSMPITPNGAQFGAAGICNPAGNVIALMPHPERTPNGKPYFDSLMKWMERNGKVQQASGKAVSDTTVDLESLKPEGTEIFIETIIVNNEERTVEQTARRYAPSLSLKQWKYFRVQQSLKEKILNDLAIFNPNKERAYIRRDGKVYRWNNAARNEDELESAQATKILSGSLFLRRDLPDTVAESFGKGVLTGICYGVNGVGDTALASRKLLEVLYNPHASELKILR